MTNSLTVKLGNLAVFIIEKIFLQSVKIRERKTFEEIELNCSGANRGLDVGLSSWEKELCRVGIVKSEYKMKN